MKKSVWKSSNGKPIKLEALAEKWGVILYPHFQKAASKIIKIMERLAKYERS